MKILVTGSSGRLGSAVMRELLGHGHEVGGVDRQNQRDPDLPESVRIDLTRVADLVPLLDGVEVVCHLGNIPNFLHDPSAWAEGFTNNVASTYAVFEAAFQKGVRKFVYASSIQAYGCVGGFPGPSPLLSPPLYLPLDEDHPLLPRAAYPQSKAMGEWIAEAFCRRDPALQVFSLRYTAIRTEKPKVPPPGGGFKGSSAQEFKGAVLEPLSPEALKPPSLTPSTDLARRAPSRNPWLGVAGAMLTQVHVKDAARLTRLCCEADRPGHTAVNVVSPRPSQPWSREALEAQYGLVPPFRRDLRPDEPLISPDRARQILGFTAELL